MQLKANLPDTSIKEVVEQIFVNRKITRTDQRRFMTALLSKTSLTESERIQINRVFDALRKGLLKVTD